MYMSLRNSLGAINADGHALLARPSGAPGAVHEGLRVLGQGEVDHVGQVRHVDTARGHVRGHQDGRLAVAEAA